MPRRATREPDDVGRSLLIAGVEVLNGFRLTDWSASLTCFAMERYWPFHGGGDRPGFRDPR